MNPSYNGNGSGNSGGAGNIPGAKPGVIVSGSGGTGATVGGDVAGTGVGAGGVIASGSVAGGSVASGSVEPVMPDGSAISSGPSRVPTGGRPVGSEIVLNDDGSTKRKRNLIIAGVLAGVLVVAVIVVLVVVMNRGGGKGDSSNTPSFNRLINYITSGTEVDKEITKSYNDSEEYYFSSDFESEDVKNSVYNKTKNLVDGFVGSYQNGDNQSLNDMVKTIKDLYDFMYIVDLKNPVSEPDAIKKMIENGTATTKKELLNYYDFSGLSSNVYVDSFNEPYVAWIDALVEEVDFFKNNNCINGSYMVPSCIINKNDANVTARWNEIAEKVRIYYTAWGMFLDNSDDFVENVYVTNDLMRGKTTIINEGGADE